MRVSVRNRTDCPETDTFEGAVNRKMNAFRNEVREDDGSHDASVPCLLFVDDDCDIQVAARLLFQRRGIRMLSAYNAPEALTLLASHPVDLVLLDLNYTKGARTGAEGLALLKDMLVLRRDLPVLVVTGHSGVTIAVAALRAGATDFVMKPWNNDRLVRLVSSVLEKCGRNHFSDAEPVLIAASQIMKEIVGEADRIAATRASVVISGPSGVGKALLARRIHALSSDKGAVQVFSAEDCQGLPEAGGVWICRDIEALSPALQRRLTDRLDESVPPRVIALSSQDPAGLSARLQPKLMLHLGMVTLKISPLRERPDDVAALTSHFLHYFSVRHGLPEPECDATRIAALQAEAWPQNVRELRAAVERVVIMGEWQVSSDKTAPQTAESLTLRDTERSLVEAALHRNSFNVTKAAKELGLTRPALYRRMARYGL